MSILELVPMRQRSASKSNLNPLFIINVHAALKVILLETFERCNTSLIYYLANPFSLSS